MTTSKPSHLQPVNPPTLTGGRQVGPSGLGHTKTVPGYSEKNFYVAGSDDKGRSASLRISPGKQGKTVPFPRYIAAQVQELIESDHTPYRYQQDFIRDAVIHRLHYLQQFRKDDGVWETFVELSEIYRTEMEAIELAKAVSDIDGALDRACEDRDLFFYDQVHKRATALTTKMREPYKSRLETVLQKYSRPR